MKLGLAYRHGAIAVALLVTLSACASSGFPGSTNSTEAPASTLGGRWMLVAPNAPACGLDFTEGDGSKGIVRPDGGCPAAFYKSRRWIYEQNALTIKDADDELLGQLTLEGGQFQGKAANGTPISLTRPIIPTAR